MTPSLRKTAWPGFITDALGIPSVQGKGGRWHSTGDTTDVAWFHAMCDALGIPYPGERIRAMKALIEASGGTWNQELHSSLGPGKQPGGNVRKEGFEELWSSLVSSGRITSAGSPTVTASAFQQTEEQALPEKRTVVHNILLRRGQPLFRRRLIAVYGSRCAITGSDVVAVLEAAHITSHGDGGSMATTNGLLLRADVHTLFDLRLIAVDTTSWTVLVHPVIADTKQGAELAGRTLRLPSNAEDHPSTAALDNHRERAGL